MIKVSEYSVNSDVTEYSDDRLLNKLLRSPHANIVKCTLGPNCWKDHKW